MTECEKNVVNAGVASDVFIVGLIGAFYFNRCLYFFIACPFFRRQEFIHLFMYLFSKFQETVIDINSDM